MKKRLLRIVSILLLIALCASLFTACGSTETSNTAKPETNTTNVTVPEEPIVEEDPAVAGLSAEQKASMAMLNYLAFVVQDINASRHSRVALEETFDSLLNDVEPSSVDNTTRQAFQNIFETIKQYRMNNLAYERMEFIKNQDIGVAILSFVPNPKDMLETIANAKGDVTAMLVGLSSEIASSAIDGITDSSETSPEELFYLERQWDLEDSEEKALMDSRTNMFDYMVQIAQGLPKGVTLSENDIAEYVTQTTKSSGAAKLDWLEKNQEKYQYFGYYWLELADSYYENKDYKGCIAAIATYRAQDTGIFKLDKRLAQSLSYAILSARETLSGSEYEKATEDYIDTIVANIGTKDWELRYYAAMAYCDLYAQTNNTAYLQKAYNEVKNNVRNLVPEQKEQNKQYLEDVIEIKAEDEADKEESSIVKAYNKYIKNKRKTELPPVYEPLLRNCELLFALAEKLNIPDSEKKVIDSMLHDETVFLSYEMDQRFSFTKKNEVASLLENSLNYSGALAEQKLTIPVVLAPEGTKISAVLVNNGQQINLDDWSVNEVDRNKSSKIGEFKAAFTCKAPKIVQFKEGDSVTIQITPPGAISEKDVTVIKLVVEKVTVLGVTFKQVPAE